MIDETLPRVYYPRAVVVLACLFESDPTRAYPIIAIPRSVTVERNTARKADTASIELDYRDFPLDPRGLIDVQVTVHMASVADALAPLDLDDPEARMFIGVVDEPRITLGANDQTVKLEARDYTALYLDHRWGPETPVPTPAGLTLQWVVELIRVQVTPQLLPAVFDDPATAALVVHSRTGRTTFTSQDADNAWDLLSALCDKFGLVPVFVLDVLHIRSATWPGRGLALMTYGRNVDSLQFWRSLKQEKSKQVLLVAWNPVLGQVLEAVWPTSAEVLRLDETGAAKPRVQQVQYNVEGAYDPGTLLDLAKAVHAEISQGQLEGELETRQMTDLLDGDLLQLANGDQLVCRLGPEDIASVASMSYSEAILFLSDYARPNALDPVVAAVLMDSWSAAQDAVTFYVAEVEHKWERDSGYRCLIRFRDYVLGV